MRALTLTPNAPTVLITGGSTGIGLACARCFLRHGWNVSVFALPGPELNALTGEMLTTPGDITDQYARERAVERTLRRFDRIDVLINNAGVGLYSLPSTVPIDL